MVSPSRPLHLRAGSLLAALLAFALLAVALLVVAGCDTSGGNGGGGGGGTPTDPGPMIILTPEAGEPPRVVLRSGGGSAGTTLELEVVAEGVERMSGAAFELAFPVDLLRFDQIVPGTFLGATVPTVTQVDGGRILVLLVGAGEGNGSGVLVRLRFTAVEDGDGRFDFVAPEATRRDGTTIDGIVWHGAVVRVVL